MSDNKFKVGSVTIIGRPNVGKSTLLNAIISDKLSIVSRRPQTTRHQILGVLNQPGLQIAFYDTPGFQHRFKNKMNIVMNRTVRSRLDNVNVVILLIEALRWKESDLKELETLSEGSNVFLVINKVDSVEDKSSLLPFIDLIKDNYNFAEIVPISALRSDGVKLLIDTIGKYLDSGDPIFEIDVNTDRGKEFFVTEFIREQLYLFLGDEIPYKSGVVVEDFDESDNIIKIKVAIVVDRKNHKGIVIGNKGGTLKKIVSSARLNIEKKFSKKVFLEVWVKVHTGWIDSNANLRDLAS